MAQPFQFDIYGAPPADPSAGFAAFAQGMGNAANLRAQSGGQFGPLRQVAENYMRLQAEQQLQEAMQRAQREAQARALAQDYQMFQQRQALDEREQGATEAYHAATLSQQKSEMEQSFGLKRDELSIARRNAELRERGLNLEAERAAIARLAEQRALNAQQARAETENRLRIQQQLRMMGPPNDVLGGITDPVQHGETEAQYRSMFRELGRGQRAPGAPQGQQPNLMQQIVPGIQMPEMGQPLPAEPRMPQRPGLTRHPLDRAQVAPAASQAAPAAEPDQTAAEIALANEIAAQAKANGWTREQARVAYLKAARAAGIQ